MRFPAKATPNRRSSELISTPDDKCAIRAKISLAMIWGLFWSCPGALAAGDADGPEANSARSFVAIDRNKVRAELDASGETKISGVRLENGVAKELVLRSLATTTSTTQFVIG